MKPVHASVLAVKRSPSVRAVNDWVYPEGTQTGSRVGRETAPAKAGRGVV